MFWEKIKEKFRQVPSVSPQEADQDVDDFAAEKDYLAFHAAPEVHMRLLQVSAQLDESKAQIIRTCIALALPIIEDNPDVVAIVNRKPQKFSKVYQKTSKK